LPIDAYKCFEMWSKFICKDLSDKMSVYTCKQTTYMYISVHLTYIATT